MAQFLHPHASKTVAEDAGTLLINTVDLCKRTGQRHVQLLADAEKCFSNLVPGWDSPTEIEAYPIFILRRREYRGRVFESIDMDILGLCALAMGQTHKDFMAIQGLVLDALVTVSRDAMTDEAYYTKRCEELGLTIDAKQRPTKSVVDWLPETKDVMAKLVRLGDFNEYMDWGIRGIISGARSANEAKKSTLEFVEYLAKTLHLDLFKSGAEADALRESVRVVSITCRCAKCKTKEVVKVKVGSGGDHVGLRVAICPKCLNPMPPVGKTKIGKSTKR